MKLLYIPARISNKFNNSKWKYLYKIYEKFEIYKVTNFRKLVNFPISAELMYFGEIVDIIGKENFYILDGVHQIYFEKEINKYKKIAPSVETHPSCFHYTKPTFINFENLDKIIDQIDIIIYSAHAHHDKYFNFIKNYIKKVPIILLDRFDHQQIYLNESEDIYRGFKREMFDMLLKQDVPLDNKDNKIYPIGPLPSKKIKNISFNETAKYNFSFFGKYIYKTRVDRADLIKFLSKNFSNNFFLDSTAKKISQNKMNEILKNTLINLSPSGIVWDSFRHSELANYGSPILLPKPTNKVVEPFFRDEENCLFYDTKIINGQWRLINEEILKKKLLKYLHDKDLRKTIYLNYVNFINNHHTRYSRSNYIFNLLKKLIKT